MRHPTKLAGLTLALSMIALSSPAAAQDRPDTPPWSEEPPARVAPRREKKPQIDLRWDVYYHVDELNAASVWIDGQLVEEVECDHLCVDQVQAIVPNASDAQSACQLGGCEQNNVAH